MATSLRSELFARYFETDRAREGMRIARISIEVGTTMKTRLQTLGWSTWALIFALIALVLLAVFLVTPAR